MDGEEQVQAQEVVEEATGSETDVSFAPGEEEDESLPFPTARIVKLMREGLHSGKQIRSEVKEAINIWMGNLLKKLANEMNNTQLGSVGMADFLRATKPYDMVDDIVKDRERLMLCMEKIKQDADQTKRDMGRFFKNLTGKDVEEPQV